MDTTNPYNEEQDKKKKKPTPTKPEKTDEEANLYAELIGGVEEEDPEEVERDSLDRNDPDSEYEEEEGSFFKSPKGIAVVVAGIAVIGILAYFLFIKGDPAPTAVSDVPQEAINPGETLKEELYKMGIGKDVVNEDNIYEQGSIESGDFRKDFVNNDSPENYVLPIEITAVNDSVSYTKHRTMTDDGIDMYWVDALYKGKKTRFTIPYYIWQTLAPQGVMDVIAEVVTDAEENTFITSITAVPPSTEE